MFNAWDTWDRIFYDILKIYDILVLFPYKEITKTLNSIFSKPRERNFNIFSGISFQVSASQFMPKKWWWKDQPPKKTMRGGAYKIIVSETREMFTLPKGLFPGQAGGEGAYSSFSCNLGKKLLRTPRCAKEVS